MCKPRTPAWWADAEEEAKVQEECEKLQKLHDVYLRQGSRQEGGMDNPKDYEKPYQTKGRAERDAIKARAQEWIDSGGFTAEDEEDEESTLPGGRMAAGEGASQPKDWSVPKFGEDDPALPDIPSTRNEKGVRIIIPATISC